MNFVDNKQFKERYFIKVKPVKPFDGQKHQKKCGYHNDTFKSCIFISIKSID